MRVRGSRARWIPSPAPPEAPSRKGTTSQHYSLHPLWASLTLGVVIGCETRKKRRKPLMRKIGIIAVLSLMALAIAAVPALAAKPGTGGTSGNPHYVGGGP